MADIVKEETMFNTVKQKLKKQGNRINKCYQFDIGNDGYIRVRDDERIEYNFKDKSFIIENDEEAYQMIDGEKHKVMSPMLLTSISYILDGHLDAVNMLNSTDIIIPNYDDRIKKAKKIALIPFVLVFILYGILPILSTKFKLPQGLSIGIALIMGIICVKKVISIVKR